MLLPSSIKALPVSALEETSAEHVGAAQGVSVSSHQGHSTHTLMFI